MVPSIVRKKASRAYVDGLDPKHTPPEETTTRDIITVIRELMEEEFCKLFAQLRATTGGTFLGEQSDMMTKNRCSFITLLIHYPCGAVPVGGPEGEVS